MAVDPCADMTYRPGPLPVFRVPRVSMNQRAPRHTLQGRVPKELFTAVHTELRRERRSIREFLEWACKEFLFSRNPKRAAELGIVGQD